jgi:hypothetical protein
MTSGSWFREEGNHGRAGALEEGSIELAPSFDLNQSL